jgi:hypothetical protein
MTHLPRYGSAAGRNPRSCGHEAAEQRSASRHADHVSDVQRILADAYSVPVAQSSRRSSPSGEYLPGGISRQLLPLRYCVSFRHLKGQSADVAPVCD